MKDDEKEEETAGKGERSAIKPPLRSAPEEPLRSAEEAPPVAADIEESEEESEDEEGGEETVAAGEGEAPFVDDDVPTTAYDLDLGRPIERGRAQALPWKSKVKNAKEFFNAEILYRFDILELGDRRDIAGSYRIELKGYRGGVWTVLAGDELSVVNRREEAEVSITMQQRDFLSLVNGDMNPQLAILAQKMRVTGNIRKAIHFQALLFPAGD